MESNNRTEMKLFITKLVSRNIFLYSMWFFAVRKRKGVNINFFKKNTEIYIDGYPRSGNTFLINLIKILFPDVKIVHHLHVVAGIKLSILLKVPTYILYRDPLEAISSNYLKHYSMRNKEIPENIDKTVLQNKIDLYINYYSFVLNKKKDLRIISFNDLINSPKNTLRNISLNLDFLIENNISKEIINDAIDIHKNRKTSVYGGRMPNKQKEAQKKIIKECMKGSKDYTKLLKIYDLLNKLDQ